jgi:KDO2-lipid IV(A) lauroyltransferase
MARKKYLKRTKRWLVYVIVHTLIKFIRLLPRRVAIFIMKNLARVAFYLFKSRRLSTIKHLNMAFAKEKSSAEIKQMAEQVFLNFGICAVDAIRIPKLVKNGLNDLISVEGRERLDEALKGGKGAILLTAHFGNWELLGAWMAKNGYTLRVVGSANKNARLEKLIVETRNNAGYFSIARSSATRSIIRALLDNNFIGMLIDQDTKVEGVFVKFFNQWAHTAVGPVVLARKYERDIIPVFLRLKDDLTYHLEVKKPIELDFTGDNERDLLVNTQKCSDAYEQIIRQYPEQWAWIHPRWKKQPITSFSTDPTQAQDYVRNYDNRMTA